MLSPIYLHLTTHEGEEARFDTLLMVNGSIAALCQVTKDLLGGYPGLAIDEAFPGPEYLRKRVREEIEAALSRGDQPVVFCTIVSYNVEPSLKLLRELKDEYGARIRTGVGGQLVRVAPQAYLNKPYLDHIAVGDAEVTLKQVLLGNQRFATGYLFDDAGLVQLGRYSHYAPLCYDNYAGLPDRLEEMSRYEFGPFSGFRQLVTESVRGCAWAWNHGTCDMCALERVKQTPIFRPLEEHCRTERDYVEHYGINWLFDVSNQWLPEYGKRGGQFLRGYIEARKRFGAPDLNRYVYLTANSITAETAPLLREAGVQIAYVGIDGWEEHTRKALGKAQSVDRMLKQLRDAGIYLRTSVVIGAGLTEQTLNQLPSFIDYLSSNYGDVVLSLGCFMEIILPGSPVWSSFHDIARGNGITEAVALYDKMYSEGWLSHEEECRLTALYIDHTQRVSYDQALEVRNIAQAKALAAGVRAYTIEDGNPLYRRA